MVVGVHSYNSLSAGNGKHEERGGGEENDCQRLEEVSDFFYFENEKWNLM